MELGLMFLKLVISLGVVLLLMFLTFKFANNGVKKVSSDKYIKVIDRTQIGKDISLLIVKVGEEGWIMSTSNGNTEKLKELTKEEILEIEKKKKQKEEDLKEFYKVIEDKMMCRISTIAKKIKAKEEKNG
ncbi:hypothetical protein HMPREF1092_01492 [Clostridium thermobutyricum]|uniref:Flagellar formation protein n=1 Tax=Clostridium thermobutyricum TaxID=29372 RepID=N9Y384_9CLOT|nr:flagellar biosynthetic protein FliO [Clostridium thermobutyricum]ENZ02257.1 hypothetical protein HMPREF1092_01492 [Clostridium thermobutyricum]